MNPIQEDILMHYGVKRRSGRYPWGSGENPYQHGKDFLARVEELQGEGKSEKEIAAELKMSTTDLRMQVRVAKHERRALLAARAQALREDGKTLDEIAQIMGYNNDSSVRALLNETTSTNKNQAAQTAEILKKELEKKGALDVGIGVERELGVSSGVLEEALFILETQGYNRFGVGVPNTNDPTKRTTTKVISVPEIEQNHFYQPPDKERGIAGGSVNLDEIKSVGDYHSVDGGKSWDKREYPASISSDRVKILYGDEGGKAKDGVIEIRRGIKDLDLGNSNYAQVRIMVDGTHYLKGMAMYGDDKDFPKGVDIIFNTNKSSETPKMDVLKPIKENDPDNPFGAYIKANGQSYYPDPKGNYTDPITGEKMSLSAINKLKEEGDWDKMSRNLSSQFLSKQPIKLIQSQLDLTYADARDEFNEIKSLTNPTIKKKLLMDFADECDSAAVHLQAAALPRQSTQVILPLTKIKPTEIYAPNYKDGEKVALVRYPHGGTFEIPILTVNNKNPSAISILGKNIRDAVGIHPDVAERLSGADFDGDQVVVIPTGGKVNIKSTPALKGLEGFDPKVQYSTEGRTGVKLMSKEATQKEMGVISNLITDMTLRGAGEDEITKAVRHSMVVIDAAKHKLDYKQSELDNDILTLRKKWQGYTDGDGKERGGATTLLSRHKQDTYVPERQGSGRIDPDTGEMIYKESGRTYTDKKGNTVEATEKVKLISVIDDVHKLSSGTIQEEAYADYANRMKAMANEARLEYLATPRLIRSASAAKTYQPEVDRLTSALKVAQMNAPREREAHRIANSRVRAKIEDNNITDKDEISKIRRAAINEARVQVGADGKGSRITISDGEWKAIQAGAISDTTLQEILRYADQDALRERATPRTRTEVSEARQTRIRSMANSGYTNAQIAEALNLSASTVSRILNP